MTIQISASVLRHMASSFSRSEISAIISSLILNRSDYLVPGQVETVVLFRASPLLKSKVRGFRSY